MKIRHHKVYSGDEDQSYGRLITFGFTLSRSRWWIHIGDWTHIFDFHI